MLSHFPLTFLYTAKRVHLFMIWLIIYSWADGNGLSDHLREVPWKDIYKFGSFAAAAEFRELVQVWIDVYISGPNLEN